jgi:hypothetical protein
MCGEELDVFRVLAERRHRDGDDIEAVEKVEAEFFFAHRPLQVSVGGREETNVQLDGSRSTNADKFAFLKHA